MVLQQSVSIQPNKFSIPGPPALPFIGSCPLLKKHLHLEFDLLAKRYGNIFQLRIKDGRTLVVLNGLETIKEALVKQQDNFNARADFDIFQAPPQSHFVELKSGEPWKKHHSIVSKAMHTFVVSKSEVLESWVLEEVESLANIFLKFDGQPFNPELHLPLASLSFIQRLIFDKRGTVEDLDFVETALDIHHFPKFLDLVRLELIPKIWHPIYLLPRWQGIQKFVKSVTQIQNYLAKNIDQHRESFDPKNLRDITDALLKYSSELTESDRTNLGLSEADIVHGSLFQFVGAGGGFPDVITRWALLYMITHPEIQTEIQKELDEVIGREQSVRFKHRSQLPFTEACINETLRHCSITTIPAVNYTTTTDTLLEGYLLPKNTPLVINYYGLTRDERHWKEPEKFNPHRFLDENGKFRRDLLDKFYPFGVGSRRCMGEYLGRFLIFLIFTNLVHKFKFEKVPNQKLSFEPRAGIFLIPKDNFKVVAKSRF